MHNKLPAFFFFIDRFEKDNIRKLDKKVAIIYRNYKTEIDIGLILNIKNFCRKDGRKFFLSNDHKVANNLDLDGVYIPAFNSCMDIKRFNNKKKFLIIGSAHSLQEIRQKEKQGVALIFISPLFKTVKQKKFFNPLKFNLLSSKTNKKVIALGGITEKNLNKLKIVKSYGFAGITYFKNNDNMKTLK
jgi:thiamine-phosphate pyrophosphorylase